MRVLMLSDQERAGGAAVAASRLASGLSRLGCEVIRAVFAPAREPCREWSTIRVGMPACRGAARARRAIPVVVDWFDQHSARQRWEALLGQVRPDAVSVHNIHAAPGWTAELVRQAASAAPTAWTLHDMWAFTGRCIYSYDCQRFLTGCDASCPTPTQYPALSPRRIAGAWRAKREAITSTDRLTAVCPSRWIADQARSGMWGPRVVHIPNGLPLDVYYPLERSLARKALGLPPDTPVLLIAADSVSDPRKGGAVLAAALRLSTLRPLTVLTVGRDHFDLDLAGVDVRDMGHLTNERLLMLAYNAADMLIHPALADNLPNVVMEAMSCGTPTVAFPIGGLPDMVRSGETGWLAVTVAAESLADAIADALVAVSRGQTLRDSCRAVCEAEYSLEQQAAKYLELFRGT